MQKIHNRITLGKLIICVGLFAKLVFLALPLIGVTYFGYGTPSILAAVLQVGLFAGGLVVYALEPRDNIQRLFALVAACAAILTLISTESTVLPVILLAAELLPSGLIVLTKSRLRRKIFGIIALVLSLIVIGAALGYIHSTIVSVLVTAAAYAVIGVGLFM